jgi:hypothetical protein
VKSLHFDPRQELTHRNTQQLNLKTITGSKETRKSGQRRAGGSYDFFKGLRHPIKGKQKD